MTTHNEKQKSDLKRTSQGEAVKLGTVVNNRYQVVAYLGCGGMSTVYKALDMRTGTTVALKILHSELVSDTNRVKRFMQEAKTYKNLRHPHIVKTFDFFLDDDERYCLVMEYHEGRNLAQVLSESGRLTIRRAVKVFSEICDALEHAHSKGIVHRDLKPSNIALVEKDSDIDYVKVLDFGIAKAMPQDNETLLGLTQTGEIVGSPLYMSPEQCMAMPVDHRSDIYSLGCLMYESLVGQPPLLGGNVYETFHMQTHERAKALGDIRPEYKSGTYFEHIIFKCMAKNPKHRYQNMNQVREALARVGIHSSKSLSDKLSDRMVQARAQRGKGIPAYIAAGITAVVILTGVWFSRDQIRVLIEPAEARYGNAVQEYRDAFNSGDYRKAEENANNALTIAEKERPQWLKPALDYLIDLYRIEGRVDEAKSLLDRKLKLESEELKLTDKTEKRLLSKLRTKAKEESDDTIQLEDYCFQLTDLADTYMQQGEVRKARKLLQVVKKIADNSLPENNLISANIIDSLALARLKDNDDERYDEIAEQLQQAVEHRETVAGKESSGLIQPLEALSEVQRRQGNLKDAKANAYRALNIARNAYRSTSLQAALSRCQLAEILLSMNQPVKAGEILTQALASMSSVSETDEEGQAQCLVLLGESLFRRDKYSDSLTEFEKGKDLVKNASDGEVLVLSRALSGLADVEASPDKRHFAAAEGLYKRSLAILFRSRAREEARVLNLLEKIKDVYREQKKGDEIVSIYKIVEKLDRSTGKAKGVIEDRQLIADYYRDKQQYSLAAQNFESALEQSQQFYGARDLKTCELMAQLADTYLRDQKVSKAALLINEAESIMRAADENKVSRKIRLQVLSTLSRFLEKSGPPERLKKVKEELDSV